MDLYKDYITQTHSLYDRYQEDWRLCLNSWLGGTEYRNGRYLRAYQSDMNAPGETINTYLTADDGSVIGKSTAKISHAETSSEAKRGGDSAIGGSFYSEKLANTPLYNYVKLIVSEYNAMLFRNPPQRDGVDLDPIQEFLRDVDGEGNSINEFMSMVDVYTSVFGVCHVACYKPAGAELPRFKIHSPLEITNWSYAYNADGNLELESVCIQLEDSDYHTVYRYITRDTIETVFHCEDHNYEPPAAMGAEYRDSGVWSTRQENELGYIPLTTIYQSTKTYNGVGSTPIQDIAQIQRSIYGYMAEIYASVTYGAHPTLVVDENTQQLNDGQVGAEPGSVVVVSGSMAGQPNYEYKFVAPSLDAITEISDLVDNQVNKLSQLAMLRSEELIKASRSGEHVDSYDDKLSAMVRRKATNMENAEYRLWMVWFDWMGMAVPDDFGISYSRHYNRKGLEQEAQEINKIMDIITRAQEFGVEPDQETLDQLQSRLAQLLRGTSSSNGF